MLPPSTGPLGLRVSPQASVTVGNVDGAVADNSQLTVELFDIAGIEIVLLGTIV